MPIEKLANNFTDPLIVMGTQGKGQTGTLQDFIVLGHPDLHHPAYGADCIILFSRIRVTSL